MTSETTGLDKIKAAYIITANDINYTIDPEIFAKMSNKFKKLRKVKPTYCSIKKNVSTEVLDTFIRACQLKQFDVDRSNAFQLLDLALEWEVPSLIRFVRDYIRLNNIEKVDKPDYVGILMAHIAENTDNVEDWTNVATNMAEALTDKRLLDVPPEILYQIIAIADKNGFESIKENKRLLIEFALKLLDTQTEKAIPIILLLDFSLLTPEEYDKIFKCRQMHEQNINFFLAYSMSALLNRTDNAVARFRLRTSNRYACLRQEHQNHLAEIMRQENEVYDREVDDIMDEIDRQQDLIDELKRRTCAHRAKVQQACAKVETVRLKVSDEERARMHAQTERALSDLSKEVDAQLAQHAKDIAAIMGGMRQNTDEYFERANAESVRDFDVARNEMQTLTEFGAHIEEHAAAVQGELNDVKALLAAKVVRDKMRYDQFIRRTNKKHRMFDEEPRLWGLTARMVADADVQLTKMENALEELCPKRSK